MALAIGMWAQGARAGNFVVTQIGNSGAGSLRQAILDANAAPGADTIQFNLGPIANPPVFINLMGSLPAITGDVTITGPGASQVLVQTDPTINPATFPLFVITGSPTVVIRGLSMTNGGGADGAAIRATAGTLSVVECALYQNNASNSGGAISMNGAGNCTLNITDSTLNANGAINLGGAVSVIRTSGVATVNLSGATLSHNAISAAGPGHFGGGLYVAGGVGPHVVSITNSTINDNALSSGGTGGGVYVDLLAGSCSLTNSTISGNTSDVGSAIAYTHASLTIRGCTFTGNNAMNGPAEGCILDINGAGLSAKNTILSGNIASGAFRDLAATQTATGNNNLIGIGGPFANGVNGNIVGVTDPRLVPINTNGGTNAIVSLQPPTFALQPDSPALDTGSNADAGATDQRGQPRPSDGDNNGTATADIGAFESQRYLVTTTADSGTGSLRAAINANNGAGGGFVKFAIPTIGQQKTISPIGALPMITRIAFIDGWSQGGQAYQGPPLIEIEGSNAPDTVGLDIQWSDCIVRGLSINNFAGTNALGVGVRIDSSRGLRNWIYGNYIGVRPDGVTGRGNGQFGVWIRPTANSNIIGTNADNIRDTAERNVISGTTATGLRTGVYIESNSNIIAGNYIGTNAAGTSAIPNFNGVWVRTGSSNQIGTSPFSQNQTADRNVIAGNQNVGVSFTALGGNCFVSGNYIGIKSDGSAALPNMNGVLLDDVNRTLIGGTSPGERNIISGNLQVGVITSGVNAYSNLIQGNYIGTNPAGTAAIGNGLGGITLRAGVTFTRIGAFGDNSTLETARRNVISGNGGPGVVIQDGTSTDNRVMGDYIGVGVDGHSALGNLNAGVLILSSPNNLVGSTGSGRNVIGAQVSSTSGDGVMISGAPSQGNKVRNNLIGMGADGSAVGNGAAGVTIGDGASFNIIGGTQAGEGNTIANNGAVGVRVLSDAAEADSILGNSIVNNARLGIDLKDDGVTPNGPANFVRVGPNALQNYPVLTSATPSGVITATLAAKASTTFRIEYFSSVSADPLTFGEGHTFLGFRNVVTDSSGNAGPFTFSAALPAGENVICATATELAPGTESLGFPTQPGMPLGTSEFSMIRVVNTAPSTMSQSVNTLEDTDVLITLTASDPDPSPVFTFQAATIPTVGQLLQFGSLTPITSVSTTISDASGRVVFRPAPNQFASAYATFDFIANDGLADSNQSTVTINVAPVADTPSVTDSTTIENVQTTTGLVISRNPVDGPEVTHFKITSITNGSLFQNDGVTPIAGGQFITFAQGNAGLRFTPALNFNGTATFNVQASIGPADTGIGGGTATAHILVAPVGNLPGVTNTTTPEDTQSGSGLVVTRNTADGPEVTHFKIFGITNGSLFQNDGVTPIADGAFITVAQGNAGLRYSPNANFFGTGNFQVRSSLSASEVGVGGPAATAIITVTPVPDTPSVTNSATQEDVQTTTGLVISRNPVDGPEVTNFKITAITNGSLFLNDGVTPIAEGQFITFAQANAGLRFTPALNFVGNGSFNVQASLNASNAGIGGGTAAALIVVSAVADTPGVTNATTLEDTQSTSGLVITRNIADGPEVTHFRISGLTTGQLFQSNGTTPIADGDFILAAQGNAGLRYTPPTDFNGPVTFQVRASIGNTVAGLGGNAITATITVIPVNDRPSFTAANPPAVLEDSGSATVTGWVSSFTPGPANESDQQVLSYTLSGVTNPSLFSSAPTLDISGTLRYTPAPDANGTSQITVVVRDDGGTANGGVDTSLPQTFTITVAPVNDKPAFTAANPPAVLESTGTHSIGGFIASFTPGPANESTQQIAAVIVDQVSNPALFSALPTVSVNGTLSYTLASSGFGTSTFRVRVQDDGGTSNGGVDTSDPQTFTIIVRPAAVCHDVTIDNRLVCNPLTVQPGQINLTPATAGPGATQAITFSRPLTVNFPIGITAVTVTATYSDGLVSSCIARVTVLATDCNQNGIPDACETLLGGLTDCNGDSIPDDCQCLWDNGNVFPTDAPNANGQLSHFGSHFVTKTADDLYICPGRIARLFEFKGQLITNTVLHKAQLEFYEDCDGIPAQVPFRTFTNSIEDSAVPAAPGFTMVSYSFNLCGECFFLDGGPTGKTYWVSLIGVTDFADPNDASYWATTTPAANPSGVMGLPPMRRSGIGGPPPYPVTLQPWETTSHCCSGCLNLSYKITGESCLVAWDNGKIDLNTGGANPTAGGSPSDIDVSIPYLPRTADNFVTIGCDPVQVCYLETYIWTNCNPVRGFAEIYDNDCKDPAINPLFSATATTAELIPGATLVRNGATLNAYKLTFCAPPGWTLQGSRTYWVSSGATGGSNAVGQSLFAYNAPDCNNPLCNLTRISPGKFLDRLVQPLIWSDTGHDYAFRLAVRGTMGLISAQPTTVATPCPVDVNHDNVINAQDIFDFLTAWFSGCP